MRENLFDILQESYRELRPPAEMPEFAVEFYPFHRLNNTVRLRDGQVRVRLSDLLESAPSQVLRAVAHILLAKLYRCRVHQKHAERWRRYVSSRKMSRQLQLIRGVRGSKHIGSPSGRFYDLETIFDDLNARFFHGLLGRPRLAWSKVRAHSRLGHYDAAHNAIIVSRVFDQRGVPRYAVEYIVYHEMLHLKHPVRVNGGRRCVHSEEFRAEEELFPHLGAARQFLKHLEAPLT